MMVWLKMVKGKRDLNPLLLKLGVALGISFAGFLYSYLRTRRISSIPSPPSPHSSSAHKKPNSGSIPNTPTSEDAAREIMKETPHQSGIIDAPPLCFTSSNKDFGEGDEFLLTEFNDLVLEEFEAHSNASISPRKDLDRSMTLKIAVNKENEKEIHNLKNMVHLLRERERKLETQLLDFYGLKEQETAVLELQNRLKINSVEAKLFSLKIESLQADKQRLEAQVSEHSKVSAELESARSKIKMLKRKIRLDEEHTKEQLSHLQCKVADLQSLEANTTMEDLDTKRRLQRLKELEQESSELRLANSRLQYENAELVRRLASNQLLDSSISELPEAEALQEANTQLGQENEDLTREIEQLQANRCADVEEVVYLRWVNACLRYELRNYKGPPGKTVARDLSKSLSPKSEEKAKQLILEYANSEGNGDKSILDFDSEYWSSSQDSSLTEYNDLDDSSLDVPYATSTKRSSRSKFFSKLRKLVQGKHSPSPKHHQSSVDRSPLSCTVSGRRISASSSPFEEMGTYSGSSISSFRHSSVSAMSDHLSNKSIRRTQSFSRSSLDTRPRNLSLDSIKEVDSGWRNSDVGSSYYFMKDGDLGKDHLVEQDLDSEKMELLKFAQVLKGSDSSPRTSRRSSFTSF